MKNSFPIFLLSLNYVDGTTIVKNIEDISLTEGKGTVSRVLQTFMEVATKTSDVTELCFVLKDGLCDVDAGVEGHLLQQLGQGVHLQFRDVALGLGLDEVCDAGCYWASDREEHTAEEDCPRHLQETQDFPGHFSGLSHETRNQG